MSLPGVGDVVDAYPLTPLQQGMLYHVLSDDATDTYVNRTTFAITGDLDVEAFRSAWDEVVERHDTLRSSFVWDGVDRPLQVVHEGVSLDWDVIDDLDVSMGERERIGERSPTDDGEPAIDVTAAPLMRMRLVRTDVDEWRWTWWCHHLIADAWSVQVILGELREIYARRTGRPARDELAQPAPFRDFVAARLDDDEEDARRHWQSLLAGFGQPHRLRVPGLPAEPGAAGHAQCSRSVDRSTTEALASLARRHRVTMSTVISAAWALVVSRWARTDDVVFGVTSAGRDPSIPGAMGGVGLYINTVPCRIHVDATSGTGHWLSSAHQSMIASLRHDQTALTSIQRWSDVSPGEPLFESIVVVENVPRDPDGGGSLSIRPIDFTEHSNYPIALLATPTDQLELRLIHDTTRLSTAAATSVLGQVAAVLQAIAEDPDTPVSDVAVTSIADIEHLRTLEMGPPLTNEDRPVHRIVEARAQEDPTAVAVVDENGSLTYRELDARANGVARSLRADGLVSGDLVGIHVPRSTDTIVAMLGALKAGATYVPLDPSYPVDHLTALIEGATIGTVISTGGATGLPPHLRVLDIADLSQPLESPPDVDVGPDEGAYVIHTSGSTGHPKGVVVTHRNLVRSTGARPAHYRDPVGRFLLLSSFSFDSSVAGIYWSLFTGGTLVLPPIGAEHDVEAIADLIRDRSITHLLALPSLYRLLLEGASGADLGSLRVAIVAGEAPHPDLLDEHLSRIPSAELHNEYGPTEATVWCSVHRATADDLGRPMPIGRPIAGVGIHLLDRFGNRVPRGFAGEVFVSGDTVSPGYLHRPDLTAGRFVEVEGIGRCYRTGDLAAYADNGDLVFLGRADHQLKIRGHRIEPSAVEAAITDDPAVDACAVLGVPAAHDGHRLVAYVTPDGADLDTDELRSRLRATLPAFMVPDRIVRLDALPRLPNGKVDRAALPDPAGAGSPGGPRMAPRTGTEATLSEIWSDLLQIDDIGVTDDFFALGGDSIISIQMVSRARQAGIPLQPGLVSTHPTIADLAEAATLSSPEVVGTETVLGEVPLGPAQRWFLNGGIDDTAQWNLAITLSVPDTIDERALAQALGALTVHHDMLRARIRRVDGGWHQTVEEHGAFPLTTVEVAPDDIDDVIARAQADLDLEHGPIARAVLIRPRGTGDPTLVLIVHHLVVDVVSWTILVDDLAAAYERAERGEDITAPPRSTSYRGWISHLTGVDWSDERRFWMDLALRAPTAPSIRGIGRESDMGCLQTAIGREATTAFLGVANDAYSTRPEELLTAAVGATLAEFAGTERSWLSIEGHGRPAGFDGIDLTRTVGWFTAQYPVPVERGDAATLIKSVKETLRDIPNGGVGFGVLRDLIGDAEIRAIPTPFVNLNYVGRGIPASSDATFRWSGEEPPASRHPDSRPPFPLEIIAAIRSGELVLEWRFDSRALEEQTVDRLAERTGSVLAEVLDHCLEEGTGGFTPSDFPEAGLDQAELDELLAEL